LSSKIHIVAGASCAHAALLVAAIAIPNAIGLTAAASREREVNFIIDVPLFTHPAAQKRPQRGAGVSPR